MVTVEQGEGQFQGSTNPNETGVPQQAPANLQPNGSAQTDIQNVVSSSNLFSNPQASAIVTVSGTTGQTAQTLVAADADSSVKNNSNQPTFLMLATALAIVIGSFLIIRKFSSPKD